MDFLLTFIGKSGLGPARAEERIRIIRQALQDALAAGEEIALPGIGRFSVVEKAARPGRDPRTGRAMTIEAHKAVKFRPSKILRDKVE